MQFSNTTDKNGLIQTVEFWTRMKDGDITGTLLKQITARINNAFDTIMPLLMSYSDHVRWDDTNHTDRPSGTVNIVSGQNDYTITEDGSSLDILNITKVRILQSSSATEYFDLRRMYVNDPQAPNVLSPNPSETGVPTRFLEQGNTIYFDKLFDYSATDGIKLFFEREQSYFVSTDDTKEVGIPLPFHELLALYASLDWVIVNRPDDGNTITRIEARIFKKEKDLKDLISLRNPTQNRMTISTSGGSGNQSGVIGRGGGDSNK